MAKDALIRFRLAEDLATQLKSRTANVSEYLRLLIRADLETNSDAREVSPTPYYYRATLDEVLDGDTLKLTLDLGFEISATVTVRLVGINSPELNTAKGKRVREYIQKRLARANLVVQTEKREKYGRYLARVYYHRTYAEFTDMLAYGRLLNEELLEQKLARRYRV